MTGAVEVWADFNPELTVFGISGLPEILRARGRIPDGSHLGSPCRTVLRPTGREALDPARCGSVVGRPLPQLSDRSCRHEGPQPALGGGQSRPNDNSYLFRSLFIQLLKPRSRSVAGGGQTVDDSVVLALDLNQRSCQRCTSSSC